MYPLWDTPHIDNKKFELEVPSYMSTTKLVDTTSFNASNVFKIWEVTIFIKETLHKKGSQTVYELGASIMFSM